MDIRANVRDKRQPGWYHVDNEIYDLGLSCEALAIYNAIARYATNGTEDAYFSGKRWKKLHRVGHGKLVAGLRELMSHKLIAPTGEVTKVGAAYFELCNIDHLKAGKYSGAGSTSKQGGVLPQNMGCAKAEQGGVPPKNTNKTNKPILTIKTENKEISDNPLSKPRIKSNASAMCVEALDLFNSEILKRKGQPDYTMWPAWVKLTGDENAVFETVMGIVNASKIPDGPRLPYQLDGVFRDPARQAYWRSQYKKPEPQWWDTNTAESIIETLVSYIKWGTDIPGPIKHLEPQARAIYERRQARVQNEEFAGVA